MTQRHGKKSLQTILFYRFLTIAAALLIPLLAGEDAAEPRAALICAAKDYSREIEYAPDNLRAVDEAFWQADSAAPGLVIGGLLGLHF